jgi:hypothetical protein
MLTTSQLQELAAKARFDNQALETLVASTSFVDQLPPGAVIATATAAIGAVAIKELLHELTTPENQSNP